MIKKTLNKIFETGIFLVATGIGIAGIVQNNSANGSYEYYKNKEQKLYFVYKAKQDSLYCNFLNQKKFLGREYSGESEINLGESEINNARNYSPWSFKIGK